jgi:putative membrane protein
MKWYKKDLEQFEQKIGEIEKQTSGEIVLAIMTASSNYQVQVLVLAISILFIGHVLVILFSLQLTAFEFLAFNISLFLGGYGLSSLPLVKRLLTSSKQRANAAFEQALRLFHENRLAYTKDRTGILIYISVEDRQLQILADAGINEKCDGDFWNQEIQILSQSLKGDQYKNGINKVLEDCGKVLKQHFPIQDNNTNELPNRVLSDLKIY